MKMRIRTYSELQRLQNFAERFEYLRLDGEIFHETFGAERYLNQRFYHSAQWKRTRDWVIARDLGGDLGDPEYPIRARPIVHHMNPMIPDDIIHGDSSILDPEFLITTCHNTHNAIHYGDASLLPQALVERRPGDTILW
jgi:hypothetical protein